MINLLVEGHQKISVLQRPAHPSGNTCYIGLYQKEGCYQDTM